MLSDVKSYNSGAAGVRCEPVPRAAEDQVSLPKRVVAMLGRDGVRKPESIH